MLGFVWHTPLVQWCAVSQSASHVNVLPSSETQMRPASQLTLAAVQSPPSGTLPLSTHTVPHSDAVALGFDAAAVAIEHVSPIEHAPKSSHSLLH